MVPPKAYLGSASATASAPGRGGLARGAGRRPPQRSSHGDEELDQIGGFGHFDKRSFDGADDGDEREVERAKIEATKWAAKAKRAVSFSLLCFLRTSRVSSVG